MRSIWQHCKTILILTAIVGISCAPQPGSLSVPSTGAADFSVFPDSGYVKYHAPSVVDNGYLGASTAVGDFNGDGHPDLAAGVPFADLEDNTDTGGVAIYYGETSAPAGILNVYDVMLNAPNTNNNNFGMALASEDLNNDGIDDLIVGAPGEEPSNRGAVYVFDGAQGGIETSPSQILGEPNSIANSGFGSALAVGDMNGDTYKELIVGSYLDDSTAADAGAAWIFRGLASGIYSPALALQVTLATGAASDYFGNAVALVDYNSDGNLDLVVGAPLQNNGGVTDTGYFHVYYGNGNPTTWVSSATVPDITVANPLNEVSDYFAWSLQVADITGDGEKDLIVGVPLSDQFGTNQGLALVYEDIQSNAVYDSIIPAANSEFTTTYSGYGIGVGDLNGDGATDVFFGSPLYSNAYAYRSGRIEIYYASSDGKVYFTDPAAIFYANYQSDGTYDSYDSYFGWTVCSGDVNNDGKDDLIVGAPYDDAKWSNDGALYIYYSRKNKFYNHPDVILNSGGYRATARQYASACLVMDFNRDGINDLLVGAQGDDTGGTDSGAVFIHLGTLNGVTTTPSQTIIDPGDNSNGFGKSLATGDLNNDNFSDLVVGAYLDDTGGADRGIVYVYSSNTTTGIINLSAPTAFQTATANSDYFGYAVDVMDMDGDSDDDLLVGVPYNDTSAADSGRVVVYTNAGTTNTLLDTTADSYIYHPTGAANSGFGSALAHGVHLGTTYSDLVIGAMDDDTVYTNGGSAYIYQGSITGPAASATQSINGLDGAYSASEELGAGIAVLDLNQDGVKDIAIGACYDDDSGQNAGSVYIKVE